MMRARSDSCAAGEGRRQATKAIREQLMEPMKAEWDALGPLPSDPALEEKLGRVKHENNHSPADEAEWLKRNEEYADRFARAETKFLSELDKQVMRD